MTDRIVIEGMVFQGIHGVHEHEQREPQPFEVDVELALNLQHAGLTDDLALLGDLAAIGLLGRPVLLGTSRKSTLGRVLDLPPDQRVEATTATTALAISSGVDMVRVHDVHENVRVARMTDAVVRGWRPDGWEANP